MSVTTSDPVTVEVGAVKNVVAKPNRSGGRSPNNPFSNGASTPNPIVWTTSDGTKATVAAIAGPAGQAQAAAITGVGTGSCTVTGTVTIDGLSESTTIAVTVVAASATAGDSFTADSTPPLVV